MSSVLGHVSLLADDATLTSGQRDSLRTAARGVERALHLVNDLATTQAQGQPRSLRIVIDQVDLRDLVNDALVDFAPQATRRAITMSLAAAPGVVVAADPIRLRQVVDNLVSNAVKYNEAQGWIDIEVVRTDDHAVLTIVNPSATLDAHDLDHAFDQGYRAAAARESQTAGSGIGLSVSRDIVVSHGGTIEIASSPESRTTTLTVSLPLADA